MSILHDEGQRAIADQAQRILDARTDRTRLLVLLEQTGAFDQAFHDTALEQGWYALAVPEAYGGLGLGLIELGIVTQACGAVLSGAPFLTAQAGLVRALASTSHAGLAARWLPGLASGAIKGTLAFAERHDPLPSSPESTFTAGGLNGSKHGLTAGLKADIALVWASHQGKPALVLAELDSAAHEVIDSFDNSRLYANLVFTDTPATILAEGEAARSLALEVLAWQAVAVAHEQTGGAEALMKQARDYALERKAFGQPIGAFQSVKHRIAELYTLVELARANCIHAASRAGQADFLKAAAAARLSATEAYDTAARDCVQIHGGIGVTWEHGLHLHMRRARSLAIECGNGFFWEDLLAAELTGQAA